MKNDNDMDDLDKKNLASSIISDKDGPPPALHHIEIQPAEGGGAVVHVHHRMKQKKGGGDSLASDEYGPTSKKTYTASDENQAAEHVRAHLRQHAKHHGGK